MIKKFALLTTCSALIISVHASAANLSAPLNNQQQAQPFYIEGALGWAYSNWTDSLNYIFPSQTSTQTTNLLGGYALGGDIGYQLNQHFSIEVGGYRLPSIDYTIQSQTDTYTSEDSGTISNWLIDLAGKASFPIERISGLNVFGKFGIAYRAGEFSDNETYNGEPSTTVQTSTFDIIEPILGAGLQYRLNEKWTVNLQYLFVPYGILSTTVLGPAQADHITVPSAQIMTAGIGFSF